MILVNNTNIKDNNRYRFTLCSKLLQYDNILISHNDISKHGNNFKLTSYFYCIKYSDYIYKFLKKKFDNDIALLIIKNYLFCNANSFPIESIIKNKFNFNSNIYQQVDMSYKGAFSLNVNSYCITLSLEYLEYKIHMETVHHKICKNICNILNKNKPFHLDEILTISSDNFDFIESFNFIK